MSCCIVPTTGSTDCVCYATVGVIDPVTSALHIIIGEFLFGFRFFFFLICACTSASPPTMPCRRFPAFGCVLRPSRLCAGALLSVHGGLWVLWGCAGRERKAPLDGTSEIRLLRYRFTEILEDSAHFWTYDLSRQTSESGALLHSTVEKKILTAILHKLLLTC